MSALLSRIQMMLGRGLATVIDDAPGLQSLQVELLADETQDQVERFQDYGFASVPHPDAEVLVSAPGGLRSRAIVICVADRRYRLRNLAAGEVAIHDDQGQAVHLTRDGIEIRSDARIRVIAPTVTVEAETAMVDAATISLGGDGGRGVARIGDTVVGGVITGGSSKVFAT